MLSILLRSAVLISLLAFVPVSLVVATECDEGSEPSCLSVPVAIQPLYTINTGNWYPLTEKAMKSAVVDTALADLTSTGYFTIKEGELAEGLMNFNISLIGPAESIKLTLQLFLPDHPTFVATYSMSIKNLDHQGIYQAFEEIGKMAAQQMLDKFTTYVMQEPEYEVVEISKQRNDGALERLYELSQQYKGRSYMLSYAAKKLNRSYP